MTQCQIVVEVMVADCSTQLVQRRKTLVVRTLVMCVVARSGDCCQIEVVNEVTTYAIFVNKIMLGCGRKS